MSENAEPTVAAGAGDFSEDGPIYAGHPDPAWARRTWTSLDGPWKIAHRGVVKDIQVPFPVGSEASGVDFRDSGTFVYRRDFGHPGPSPDRSYLLRIGASDYETVVRVNGREVGRHRGGYASFSFDIGWALLAGDNRLELEVRDSHDPRQVRGKQTFLSKPFFVWYGGMAGPWQSIWIEETGRLYLSRAETRADFGTRRVEVRAWLGTAGTAGAVGGLGLSLVLSSPGGEKRLIDAGPLGEDGSFSTSFGFDEVGAALWSAEEPHLHGISYRLSQDDSVLDTVESYFGLRQVEVDREGFRINGERVFLRMVLVQGYYPGGGYTPLSMAQVEGDLRSIKAMGFNGARLHEKVESPYFQYLCDRLGLYTSFEMPSFYLPSKRGFAAYEAELRELIARDSVHPSCIMRMLFNETWGVWGIYRKASKTRAFVNAMCELTKALDPTRPVIENSGWEHFRTDVADFHHYLGTAALARESYAAMGAGREDLLYGHSLPSVLAFNLPGQVPLRTRSLFLERSAGDGDLPLFLSEYGGFGWYATEGKKEVIEDIEDYTRDILATGLFCGYCYTQLYDVGAEVNGLLAFDRRPKVDQERMRRLNSEAPAPGRR